MRFYKKISAIFIIIVFIFNSFGESQVFNALSQTDHNDRNSSITALDEEIISYNLKKIGQYLGASSAVGVAVKNNVTFVTDEITGLHVLNTSNPNNPILISNYQKGEDSIYDVIVNENYCYLAHGRSGLIILDISNLSEIVEISTYDVGGTVWKILLKNNLLFVVNRNEGIDILDITNIGNPARISRYEGQPLDVFVEGDLMYVAAGVNAGLEIVKIDDIANPKKIAELKIQFEDAVAIDKFGDYVYIAPRDNGLKIVKVSNPRKPKTIGYYKDGEKGTTWNIIINEKFAYISDDREGLEILDLSKPENPQEVGQFFDSDEGRTFSVAIDENYLFIADYTDGLEILSWEVGKPNPTSENYVIIDQGTLNFNNSVGPFQLDTFIGNESVGLNIYLFMDVGLKSPINITVEAPTNIRVGDKTNLKIKITAEASEFWAAFRGNLSFITPLGESELISLKDAGIPEIISLAAFNTFIGRNLTIDTYLNPFILWQNTILNTTLRFIMTPYFNVTGTATVSAKINNEGTIYYPDWLKDKEQIIIPVTIPEVEEFYAVPLEDFQFNIDDLRLDFYKLKFDLIVQDLVELYSWTINFSDFTGLPTLSLKNNKWFHQELILDQANERTLFHLDGIYPLGDFIIFIYVTKGVNLPPWAIPLLILALLTLLAIPWILIFFSSRRKQQPPAIET
ncbi:MAG: LVIVD repeat-containing protein [Candidatus Thorarchaeota archaeon]